jgi:DsbC/DsbD-like thiol-disulfide interchange protein
MRYRSVVMHHFNAYRLAGVSCRSLLMAAMALPCADLRAASAMGMEIPAYEAPHTRIRMFTGGDVEGAAGSRPSIGIEIVLEPGWKTYWRTPGEGISPSFSWDESLNVKTVEVLWPAPMRFFDGEGSSIGYQERVVLPVLITPENPAKPISLSLAVAYGVCKDICVPVEAQLSLDLDMPVRKADREDILHALGLVPKPQGPDAACPHRFVSARLVRLDEKPALRVETSFDGGAGTRDLMVEAPADARLAAPTLDSPAAPGQAAYLFPVEPESVSALKGKPLTFTTVSDQGSCESIASVE